MGEIRNMSHSGKGKGRLGEPSISEMAFIFFPTTPIHGITDGMAVSGFMD